MRLKKREINKVNGKLQIKAEFVDQMRRAADVSLKIHRGTAAEEGLTVVVEDEPGDVSDVLGYLAEIAWGMGWRPRGMLGSMTQYVQDYKIPSER